MSSSEDENLEPYYWNNWSPSKHTNYMNTHVGQQESNKKCVFGTSKIVSVSMGVNNTKSKNWIPPLNFFDLSSKRNMKFNSDITISSETLCSKKRTFDTVSNSIAQNEKNNECENTLKKHKNFVEISFCEKLNPDWGEEAALHNVTKFKDDDTFWGFVNLGVFGNIKLWVNEYGNVCALADGKISASNSSEITFICINNIELVRKMLNLSTSQWAALCDIVKKMKIALKFDAFENCDLTRKTSVEKLWFFICRRRHFLPMKSMQVKLFGAHKCLKKFQIIPKVIVQDIRCLKGEPIT